MTEVKMVTQTMIACQPKQLESEGKKGKILHGYLSELYFLDNSCTLKRD